MTLQEFKEEFRLKYDLQSKGGPSIDDHEMSVFLTAAAKEIHLASLDSYEVNEKSRRIISLSVKKQASDISNKEVVYKNQLIKYTISLPKNVLTVLKEKVEIKNCSIYPKIVDTRIDELEAFLINPFKRPNKNKVLRVEEGEGKIAIYSKEELISHSFTYSENTEPIIVEDLKFGLTIEGKKLKNEVNLHQMTHSKIIDLAVMMAINTTRTRVQQR